MNTSLILKVILCFISITKHSVSEEGFCSKAYGCSDSSVFRKVSKYILYDVNIGEGFNLKRDVYMRMAMFVRSFAKTSEDDWHLVLPPWTKQWHWASEDMSVSYFWRTFFEVESLQLYAPVVELDQFLIDHPEPVDEVYILQHFPEFYNWKGGDSSMDWSDRWKHAECRDHPYWKHGEKNFLFFRGKHKVEAKNVTCISFQGSSAFIKSVISSSSAKSILFDRAEIATHMMYGDSEYWMCRRSMRFAKHLVKIAKSFRNTFLHSSDEQDGTVRPLDWREENPQRNATGGPYLGVHLRRQDFVYGRPNDVPTVYESAIQIRKYLQKLNLTNVFIATDMNIEEYEYLKRELETYGLKPIRFEMNNNEIKLTEGEMAIIDQIIASHARFFVGTHESTFSFRIQEEREIMGFLPESTFNCFCSKSETNDCKAPTRWLIKYPKNNSWKSHSANDYFKTDEL